MKSRTLEDFKDFLVEAALWLFIGTAGCVVASCVWAFTIALGIYSTWAWSVVISHSYTWCVANTFGVNSLTFAQAVGITLFTGLFFTKANQTKNNERSKKALEEFEIALAKTKEQREAEKAEYAKKPFGTKARNFLLGPMGTTFVGPWLALFGIWVVKKILIG
jgi:uncharacterized membrane protein